MNEEVIAKILQMRADKAKMLGYKTYAEYATGDIITGNPEVVWDFEKNLAQDLSQKAQADLD